MKIETETTTFYTPDNCPFCNFSFYANEDEQEAKDDYENHILFCPYNPKKKTCYSCKHRVLHSKDCQKLIDLGFNVFISDVHGRTHDNCKHWEGK